MICCSILIIVPLVYVSTSCQFDGIRNHYITIDYDKLIITVFYLIIPRSSF